MSFRFESDLFMEAYKFAENVLEDKRQFLDEFDGELVSRLHLCETREALHVLVQQAQILRQVLKEHNSEQAQNEAAQKVEELRNKLRAARTRSNRANKKLKRMKRNLDHMERRCERLCECMSCDERIRMEECAQLDGFELEPGTQIEMLSSEEWGDVAETPADPDHLRNYEQLQ